MSQEALLLPRHLSQDSDNPSWGLQPFEGLWVHSTYGLTQGVSLQDICAAESFLASHFRPL